MCKPLTVYKLRLRIKNAPGCATGANMYTRYYDGSVIIFIPGQTLAHKHDNN